jgi:pyruvate/2-oxoacid:ferredoxin oxidoreductase beta subunit
MEKTVKATVNGREITVEAKSQIQIGNLKVDAPSVQEMKDFLKDNFDLLKKMDPERFAKARKQLLDPKNGIPRLKRDIENKEKALAQMKDTEDAKKIMEELKGVKDNLKKLETELKELDSQADEAVSLDRTGMLG